MNATPRINRRQLLLAGATIGALGSSGILWLAFRAGPPSQWIEAVVRKHLAGIRLDTRSLRQFAARLADEPEFKARKVSLALQLDDMAPALVRLAPEVNQKIERLERVVISEYLINSNFFRVVDPRKETIFCSERVAACGNPFAVFRDT